MHYGIVQSSEYVTRLQCQACSVQNKAEYTVGPPEVVSDRGGYPQLPVMTQTRKSTGGEF